MDKRERKMDAETLQQFLAFRKRANRVPSKKGKGSYDRKDFKKGVQQNTMKFQIIFCDTIHDNQIAQFDTFEEAAEYWEMYADTPTCFAGELKDLENDEIIWEFNEG